MQIVFRVRLVPDDFAVPEVADHPKFHLHPLRLKDAPEDYAAIMQDYRGHLAAFSDEPDLSGKGRYDLHYNMQQLGWHEQEFYKRTSFTYVIRGKDSTRPSYRGCVYLMPSPKRDHDVVVYLWVTDAGDDLEADVLAFTKRWLKNAWPFEYPVFPRAEMSMDEFNKLPDGRTYAHQVYWGKKR
ncbi:MAG: hypothetical protein U1F33_00250 [Alphaproteobacteria bacterium]